MDKLSHVFLSTVLFIVSIDEYLNTIELRLKIKQKAIAGICRLHYLLTKILIKLKHENLLLCN